MPAPTSCTSMTLRHSTLGEPPSGEHTACMHIAPAPAQPHGCNLLLAYFNKEYIATAEFTFPTCVYACMLHCFKEVAHSLSLCCQ